MAFKIIQIAAPPDRLAAITAIAVEAETNDVQVAPALEDGRTIVTIVVGDIDRQALLDRFEAALGKSENWRIVMLPADTAIDRSASEMKPAGKPREEAEAEQKEEQARASREELRNLVTAGIRTDADFILLVILSTIVASVGLEQDSIAILIGAMVIAPLLGPNVAFAFGAAIGDYPLMLSAMRSNATGIVLSVFIAAALALVVPPNIDSHELIARTSLDYAAIALALASGAAAALSITTGLSSMLVGVMVAVALLPPAVTVGIMAAAGRSDLAFGAAMLLVANIACVNLAAQVVFLTKGVRPRTWNERHSARRAVAVNLTAWIGLIGVLVAIITLRHSAGS